jgi:hypothetical protein
VSRQADRLLGRRDRGDRRAGPPVLGRAQDREVERRDVDPVDLVEPGGAPGIGVGESMDEMIPVGVGMTIDDGDARLDLLR